MFVVETKQVNAQHLVTTTTGPWKPIPIPEHFFRYIKYLYDKQVLETNQAFSMVIGIIWKILCF